MNFFEGIFKGGHELQAALDIFREHDSEAMYLMNDVMNRNFGAAVLHQEGWQDFPAMNASIPGDMLPGMPNSEYPYHEAHEVTAASGIAAVNETVEATDAADTLRATTEAQQHEYANVVGFSPRGGKLAVTSVIDHNQPESTQQSDLMAA